MASMTGLPKPSFCLIDKFPGEIRNQVYEWCIENARNAATRNSANVQSRIQTTGTIDVTAFPRWNGPPAIRLTGLRRLPMIFVSKQIYHELLALIYSKVDNVCLGGYILQYPYVDPSHRWKEAYSLLQKQPGLLKFTRKITIKLPCEREELARGYWKSMGYGGGRTLSKSQLSDSGPMAWAILPGLQEFLWTFDALPTVQLIVPVERKGEPDFASLLSLCVMDTIRVSVEFVDQFYQTTGFDALGLKWSAAWDRHLKGKDTTDLKTALEMSRMMMDART